MNSRWLLNLALGTLAVALGAFLYLKPDRAKDAMFALSPIPAREVTAIRIERGGKLTAALAREDGLWRLTAPLAAPAEPSQVDRLLAILSARSPQRMPPIELARFDLDAPPLQITFNTQVLGFGLVNAVTREQYVLTDGAVYVIGPRYAAGVPVDPMQLARRQLFASGAAPVRFALAGTTLARGDAGWTMTPTRAGVSQHDLGRFADEWRLATASRVAPAGARTALALIEVSLKDGRTVAVEVVQREPELVLRRPDLALEYTLAAGSAQRLLAPPGAAPGQ